MAGMIIVPLKSGGEVALYLAERMLEPEVREALADDGLRIKKPGPSILVWEAATKRGPLKCVAREVQELRGVVRIAATRELAFLSPTATNLRITAEPTTPDERVMALVRKIAQEGANNRFVFAKVGHKVELIDCASLDFPQSERARPETAKTRPSRGPTPSF